MLPRQFSWSKKDLLRQEQKFVQILKSTVFRDTRSVPQQYKTFFAKDIRSTFYEGGFLECFNYFLVTDENSPGRMTNHNLLKFVYPFGVLLNLLLRSVFPKYDSFLMCFFSLLKQAY